MQSNHSLLLRPSVEGQAYPTAREVAPWRDTELPVPNSDGVEFSPARVFRALRRRWFIALILAIVGAGIAGLLADKFIASTYTARTQVYFPPAAVGDPRGESASFQRRHTSLVKSRKILHEALNQPSLAAAISRPGAEIDLVAELEKDLVADFTVSPDVMRVTLKGGRPDELVAILNAIRETYLKEGANKDVTDKTNSLNSLRGWLAEDELKLNAARADVSEIAEALNCSDVAALRLQHDANRALRATYLAQDLQQEMQQTALEQSRRDLLANPPGIDAPPAVRPMDLKAATDLALAQDRTVQAHRTNIAQLEGQLAEYARVAAAGTKPPIVQEKEKLLEEAKKALAARELTVRTSTATLMTESTPQTADLRKREYDLRLRDLKSQIDISTAHRQALKKRLDELAKVLFAEATALTKLTQRAARVTEIEDRIRATKARADVLDHEVAVGSPTRAQTDEVAVISGVPNPLKKKGMVAGAILVGLLGGLLGAAFLDLRSGRIDSPEGVDRRLHTGVVGCIPRASAASLKSLTQPEDDSPNADTAALLDASDACRALLLNALSGEGSKVVMVTSALPGEGKTTLSAQLALSLARAGYRTLLIDADVRRPGLHTLFGRSIGPGLTDVLRRTCPLSSVVRKSPLPTLGLIPAGNCDPREAVSLFQLRLGSVLKKCKDHFEVIVVDTPPLHLPDGLVIGRHADGTILSLMNDVSTLASAQAACARLRTVNIPLLGAVLNAARVRLPAGY